MDHWATFGSVCYAAVDKRPRHATAGGPFGPGSHAYAWGTAALGPSSAVVSTLLARHRPVPAGWGRVPTWGCQVQQIKTQDAQSKLTCR